MKNLIILFIAEFFCFNVSAQTQVPYEAEPVVFNYPDTITGIPLSVHYDISRQEWTVEMTASEFANHGIHRLVTLSSQTAMLIINDPSITRIMIVRQSEDTTVIHLLRE